MGGPSAQKRPPKVPPRHHSLLDTLPRGPQVSPPVTSKNSGEPQHPAPLQTGPTLPAKSHSGGSVARGDRRRAPPRNHPPQALLQREKTSSSGRPSTLQARPGSARSASLLHGSTRRGNKAADGGTAANRRAPVPGGPSNTATPGEMYDCSPKSGRDSRCDGHLARRLAPPPY
ncbi:hypothetical protein NDU88_002211 [Pleurodeles waltl]|uniref:Uncharacterized protein n=1 Tax=Pleurodeles waltl TaxID=8319 RepID=A0AAV7UUW9_PLEWA|nr:hypothetical protein NDU88_002211 [Pleurodeles waltl]